jgi:hypothetical protein
MRAVLAILAAGPGHGASLTPDSQELFHDGRLPESALIVVGHQYRLAEIHDRQIK